MLYCLFTYAGKGVSTVLLHVLVLIVSIIINAIKVYILFAYLFLFVM